MEQNKYFIIKEIILKHITGEITESEKDFLNAWLGENEQNRVVFNDIIDQNNISTNLKLHFENNYQTAFSRFLKEKKEIERKKRLLSIMRYTGVAMAVILLSFVILYFNDFYTNPKVETIMLSSSDDSMIIDNIPILKLSNGEIVKLKYDNSETISDSKTKITIDKNSLIYQNTITDKLVYNELIVPEKCSYLVVLSDSSKVWVNSGSSIRYPVVFGDSIRKVYISGEVLFDVKKDKTRPFIIETNNVSIKVLGTIFNVNTYSNEENIKITLVEGSIVSNINNSNSKYYLKPNEQLVYDKKSSNIEIKNVNAQDYVLWRDGLCVLNRVKISEIARIIKRWYGVECKVEDYTIENIEVTGVLDKKQELNKFMKLLHLSTKLNYIFDGNTIILNR